MQNYQDNLIGKVVGVLQPLAGVSVTVTDANGAKATIYSNETGTVQANPMTTDAQGGFGFYASNGRYMLTFTGSKITTFTRSVELYDADDVLPVGAAALAAPTGASTIGATGGVTVQQKLDTLTAGLGSIVTSNVSKVNTVGPDGSGNISLTTDNLPESGTPTNQWFTAARVRAVVLTGLSLASSAAVAAGDSMLAAIGKLQAQFNTKDASGGFPGLTGFAINLKNAAGTITSALASAATSARTWTFPDKDGTVAMTSDIPGNTMVLLGTATVSSAVAAINFLNTFTSAYNRYVIEVEGVFSVNADTLAVRLANSGAADTATVYSVMGANSAALSSTASFFSVAALASSSTDSKAVLTMEIRNVNDVNSYKSLGVRGIASNKAIAAEGMYSATRVVTGFTMFFSGANNIVGGTVRVYGIKNS